MAMYTPACWSSGTRRSISPEVVDSSAHYRVLIFFSTQHAASIVLSEKHNCAARKICAKYGNCDARPLSDKPEIKAFGTMLCQLPGGLRGAPEKPWASLSSTEGKLRLDSFTPCSKKMDQSKQWSASEVWMWDENLELGRTEAALNPVYTAQTDSNHLAIEAETVEIGKEACARWRNHPVKGNTNLSGISSFTHYHKHNKQHNHKQKRLCQKALFK